MFIAIVVAQLAAALVKFYTTKFRVDDEIIAFKSGLFLRKEIDFEWRNVRSILLTQTLLQKRLELTSVSLATAGSTDSSIDISYIPIATARAWEHRIAEQSDKKAAVSTTDVEHTFTEDETAEQVESDEILHKLSFRDLLFSTYASLNVIGPIIRGFFVIGLAYCGCRFLVHLLMLGPEAVTGSFWNQLVNNVIVWIKDLPTNFVKDTTWLMELIQQITGIPFAQLPNGKTIFFAFVFVIVSIVILVLSRIKYCLQNYGFTLTQQGPNLHLQKGLIKTTKVTIRPDRIQTASFDLNLRERALKRGNLRFAHAAAKSDHTFEIPFLSIDSADRLLTIVYNDADISLTFSPFVKSYTPIHVMSFIHESLKTLIFLLVISGAALMFIPPLRDGGYFWLVFLIIWLYSLLYAFFGWLKKGYRIHHDHLLQREGGLWEYGVSIAPIRKVQTVALTQSWIQRPRERANIDFHFASGNKTIPYLSLSIAESMKTTVEEVITGVKAPYGEHADDIERDLDWKKLPRRYVVRKSIGKILTSFIFFVPIFIALAWLIHWSFSIEFERLGLPLTIVWGVLSIWRVVRVCIEVPRFRYAITDNDITIQRSFLSKSTKVTRFSRIQKVSTDNNSIDRLFSLSDLNLDVAEEGVHLSGLGDQDAYRLREFISARLLEISNTQDDALTVGENSPQAAFISDIEAGQQENIEWKKFSGWKFELVGLIPSVIFGPLLILLVVMLAQPLRHWEWMPEFVRNLLSEQSWPIWVAAMVTLLIYIVLRPFVEIPLKGYEVSEHALRYKEGLVARAHHFIPVSRIQNVQINTNFMERIFKVSSVSVETPGSTTVLRHLLINEGEALRSYLMNRIKNSENHNDDPSNSH